MTMKNIRGNHDHRPALNGCSRQVVRPAGDPADRSNRRIQTDSFFYDRPGFRKPLQNVVRRSTIELSIRLCFHTPPPLERLREEEYGPAQGVGGRLMTGGDKRQ